MKIFTCSEIISVTPENKRLAKFVRFILIKKRVTVIRHIWKIGYPDEWMD